MGAFTGATFLLSVILSLTIYGPQLWLEWLNSLNPWLNLHSSNPMLLRNEIAHGLPMWLKAFVAVAGIAFVAIEQDKLAAFTVAVCTALIASPHAMGYEFALLAPAVVALVRRPGPAGLAVVAFILTPALIWVYPAVLAYMARLLAVLLLVSICRGIKPSRLPLRRSTEAVASLLVPRPDRDCSPFAAILVPTISRIRSRPASTIWPGGRKRLFRRYRSGSPSRSCQLLGFRLLGRWHRRRSHCSRLLSSKLRNLFVECIAPPCSRYRSALQTVPTV